MSVSNTAVFVAELGNGVKTAFEFAFKIFAPTDLVIYKETAPGIYTPQEIVGDWGPDPDPLPAPNTCFVTFDSEAETGVVTYSEAPTNGLTSVIARNTPETQEASFPANAVWSKKVVENALDKLTMMVQEVEEMLGRAALQPLLPVNPDPIVISAPVHGKGLKWNVAGDGKVYLESTDGDAEGMAESAAAAAATAVSAASAATAAAGEAADSAEAAAASAALAVGGGSGLLEDRPAAPVANMDYWATDAEQLFRYNVAAGRWFLIG